MSNIKAAKSLVTNTILAVRKVHLNIGHLNIKTKIFDFEVRVLIGWLARVFASQPIRMRASKLDIFVLLLRWPTFLTASIRRKLLSFSLIALKSKDSFRNDLCLPCFAPHYSTNIAIIAIVSRQKYPEFDYKMHKVNSWHMKICESQIKLKKKFFSRKIKKLHFLAQFTDSSFEKWLTTFVDHNPIIHCGWRAANPHLWVT